MRRLNTLLARAITRVRREDGQATLEYALVLVAIAGLVAAVIGTGLGSALANALGNLVS